MAEFDLHSEVQIAQCISPAAITATTTTGTTVDTLNFDSLEYVLMTGVATMDGAFTLTIEESDASGSGFAAVSAAETLGAAVDIAIGEEDAVRRIGSIGKKRFQRAILTEDSANTTGVIGVIAILSNPRVKPPADQST